MFALLGVYPASKLRPRKGPAKPPPREAAGLSPCSLLRVLPASPRLSSASPYLGLSLLAPE
jgi:hypothetical protein